MSLLALIMGWVFSGWMMVYWNQPLDSDLVQQPTVQEQSPFLEWKATRYDYQLNGNRWSKTHDTCALRIHQRYWQYKVCIKWTDKCIVCKHNDYWPAEYTNKIIDLSSHAFKQLAPLSRWVVDVQIYKLDS
jgi:hypothetical protein